MGNQLARDFRLKSLLRFALPTVLMNLFVGLYYIVDGVCVAQFVGTDALAAMNITYPTFFTAMAISIMMATGGSAVVAKKMGEGKEQEARADFTFLTLVTLGAGIVFSLLCLLNLKPLLYLLGADAALFSVSRAYVSIQLCFTPAIFMQMFFQTFFVTAGKPKVGLVLTLIAGCTNIVLDLLLVGYFSMGVVGASLATCIGYAIPTAAGFFGCAGPQLCERLVGNGGESVHFNYHGGVQQCDDGADRCRRRDSHFPAGLYTVYFPGLFHRVFHWSGAGVQL